VTRGQKLKMAANEIKPWVIESGLEFVVDIEDC